VNTNPTYHWTRIKALGDGHGLPRESGDARERPGTRGRGMCPDDLYLARCAAGAARSSRATGLRRYQS
jgi:hypothetical protein